MLLGISYGHGDSSAALIVNDRLVAAAEEERFTRTKHYALFPEQAIRFCLNHAGISAAEVNTVALARRPFRHLASRLWMVANHPALFFGDNSRTRRAHAQTPSLHQSLRSLGIRNARIRSFEHHVGHLASAHWLNPKEPMALLSIDGLGDFTSTTAAIGYEGHIRVLNRQFFPNSLGYFYTAMTQYLGFPYYGDEFKVMGLSSYGRPKYLPEMRELVRIGPGFGFHLNLEAFPILKHPIQFRIENAQPFIDPFFNRNFLTNYLGIPPRKPGAPLDAKHFDLAKSVQCRFEEVADHLLQVLSDHTSSDVLGLAGGCAHNSVWVGKIHERSRFKRIFVAPASHDAGLAVGAALLAYGKQDIAVEGGHWGLLGPAPDEIENQSGVASWDSNSDPHLVESLATELAAGKVVGIACGRLEFGPRALGARSILADPRYPEMRDRLNKRVKHRETFRPFAASVLEGHEKAWFRNPFSSPYMEAVFDVLPHQRDKIASVVHNDGTCRIQTVERENQPFYWSLIEAFRQKTGIPMLINTSFNDTEPIVLSRRDAVECFKKTEMDFLLVESTLYSKEEQAQRSA